MPGGIVITVQDLRELWTVCKNPACNRSMNAPPLTGLTAFPAGLLSVSLEDLLGGEQEKIARRRGPVPKWQQLFEEIDSLPKAKQMMISEMLSTLVVQARN